MNVKDIMTKKVITVDADLSIVDAAKLMVEHKLSGLPVVKHGQVVGIITETEIVGTRKGVTLPPEVPVLDALVYFDDPANGDEVEKQLKKMFATKVRELMRPNPTVISSTASITEAATLIVEKNISPLPVVDDGRLVGMLGRYDILRMIASHKGA